MLVVGGGAAGGTLAAECARAGRTVLLVDRGPAETSRLPSHDERVTLVEKGPYDDRPVFLRTAAGGGEEPRRLYAGTGIGGGTNLYGAALLRPAADDLVPGRSYGDRLPRHLHEWPVTYEELAPFYDRAERLYHVAADPADDFGSLHPTAVRHEEDVLPLAAVNARVAVRTRRAGFAPFRLPLGVRADRCLRCDHCAGFVCPTRARTSSGDLVADAVADGHPLTVRGGVEVERILSHPGGKVDHALLRDRSDDRLTRVRAARVVLAAGAIGTAATLLRSGVNHPQLGRNFMYHRSPVAVGLFPRPTGAARTFVKQLGWADFYLGTARFDWGDCPEKLGLVQSLPAPGPLMLKKYGPPRVPAVAWNVARNHMLPLVGIVEDLPDPANRVTVTDGGVSLHHRFSDYDVRRSDALLAAMRRLLKAGGAAAAASGGTPSPEHVAHQCGTARMGTDPGHAVVAPDGRVFGHDGLFVADGSLLPTSLGVGPALTITANALRIAGEVVRA